MKTRTHGYLLVEALVYIAVVAALLGVAYIATYRFIDRSIALRRNADDITSALHAGERWRADVRAATRQARLENTDAGQVLYLDAPARAVVYRFATNAVSRRVDMGPWVRLPPNVKSSSIIADKRERVTVWRWELELQTRATGSVKPSRIRPLFTFLAVPERPATE
jgi:Tfp pilus assembly protein PilE